MADKYEIIGKFNTNDIERGQKEVSEGFKKTDKQVGGLSKGLKAFGAAVVSSFAVSAVVGFGRKVAETRGQFQKLQAVLENTLGSKSSAQQAFRVLNQLAQQSNFGLLELTDSYVKLVNQGINPTRQQMISLQDLANSTGKSFNQLTEALIDGQVSEFERLKEFGIRAKKEGDKVQFTFKGVTTEVENTSSAIKDYIIGLGDLEGVAGSTEKISGTLAGKISNLGDAFDNLLNNLGSGGGESILTDIMTGLINGVNWLSNGIKQLQPTIQSWYTGTVKALNDIVGWFQDLINESVVFRGYINLSIANLKNLWEVAKLAINLIIGGFKSAGDVIKGVFTFDWELVKKGYKDGLDTLIEEVKTFGSNVADNYVEAYNSTMENRVTDLTLFPSPEQTVQIAEDFVRVQQDALNEVKQTKDRISVDDLANKVKEDAADAKNHAEKMKRLHEQEKAQQDLFAENSARRLAASKSVKGFAKNAIDIIRDKAVAQMISSIIGSVPFPFNLVVAGGAGALVNGLFAQLSRFQGGGVIGGNSFSGDRQLVLANSGERVMNIPQQQFLMRAAQINESKFDTMITLLNQIAEKGNSFNVSASIDGTGLSEMVDRSDVNRRFLEA